MTLTRFAAGPYSAGYNADTASGSPPGKGAGARDLGLVEGVRLWQRLLHAHPLRGARYGQTTIDAVYAGGECFLEMTLLEWTAAVRDILWPFDPRFGGLGTPGTLLSTLAGTLLLTAEPHTPAAEQGPALLRFGKAVLAAEQPVSLPLGNVERMVSLRFQCFPYRDAAGEVVWFEEE